MIQPVSAFSPQAKYRGTRGAYGISSKGNPNSSEIALINAGGVSAALGGVTALLARRYTNNWAHALFLGLCGSFLSMFFMTPQILAASGYAMPFKKTSAEVLAKTESPKFKVALMEHFKPMTKNVHFKQQV